jgi:hypothetical protein
MLNAAMKIFSIIFFIIFGAYGIFAQSFRIRDYYGHTVNNDTMEVVFHPDGNHGWTELSVLLFVQNTSNSTKTLSVKKTEYGMDADEYHAICFGGTCFDSSVFISTFKDPVLSGGIDSTFSGHYRFDDLLHKPGRRLVAYTFYDENLPGDSSIVYIEYNTLQKEGIDKFTPMFFQRLSPNPSTGIVRFEYGGLNNAGDNYFTLLNSLGQCVLKGKLLSTSGMETLNIEGYPKGIYYFTLFSDFNLIRNKILFQN